MNAERTMRLGVALLCLLILAGAAWLRIHDLNARPMHFDESTNARILGTLLEEGSTPFDPSHFHGPLLSQLTAPVARTLGESSWRDLSKMSLRSTVAGASILLVVLGMMVSQWGQRGDGLGAGLMLSTSPLLVYYGRMYIHEPLFMTCGLATLLFLLRFLQTPGHLSAVGLGLGLGLMAATRETWVISVFAWTGASLVWLRHGHSSESWLALMRQLFTRYGRLLLLSVALCFGVIALSYTSCGRHPSGMLDFFRTYLVYAPMDGHEKPFYYFAELLLWPKQGAGRWWTEMGVLLFALYGVWRCPSATCRFLMTGGLLHLLVYSLISYKTPWLVCLGWVHICIAAGLGAAQLYRTGRVAQRVPAIILIGLVLGWQSVQSHRAAFRFASDDRNPYAYVPTSNDVERLADWLEGLARNHKEIQNTPVTVVGSGYWPLPWYLRSFEQVGYWAELPADAAQRPLLILMPDVEAGLDASHALFPRGLRHEVPLTIAVRKDLWNFDGK